MLARSLVATFVLFALAAAPATAAVKAKVSIASSRIVVTVSGAKPKAVTVVAAGTSYKLTKSGSKWRSKTIANAAALAGTKIKVKVRTSGRDEDALRDGRAVLRPRSAAPSPAAPGGAAPSSQLFPAPAAPSTGNAAFEAIKGYLADSRFTDCPAGWPICAVEERYSHFANGDHYYCRLTPTSGSDIKSYGSIAQISGAEHNADGSWGVEYYLSSYGNTTFYSWSVSNQGVVNGRYSPPTPGRDPSSGAPDQGIGPLQWVRGAKDCSY